MANELTLGVSLRFAKSGSKSVTVSRGGLQIDVAGLNVLENVQTVGIAEEPIELADVGAGGYVYLENLDAEDFILIRPSDGEGALLRLLPGEVALFRIDDDAVPTAAVDGEAEEGATCDLLVVLLPL